MSRSAVVLTHNRPEQLRQTVDAIGAQVDRVFVMDNASTPSVDLADLAPQSKAEIFVLHIPTQPPSLSRFWCYGLDLARATDEPDLSETFVAFLCDDAPPPPGWFDAVHGAMELTGAAIGCSPPDDAFAWHGQPRIKTTTDGSIMERMPGWAFILRASSGIRPDVSMSWWWFDTDLDWQARLAGGMVMIGSHAVKNVHPNDWTWAKPELGAQTGIDREAFVRKHGLAPW